MGCSNIALTGKFIPLRDQSQINNLIKVRMGAEWSKRKQKNSLQALETC